MTSSPIEKDVTFEIDEQFPVEGVPSSYNAQDYARVVPDEPFPMFDENNLIVEALLRQGLLLEIPLQPLCEFGWDGPCPIAAKRDVKQAEPINPAMQGLKKLLHEEGDNT